MDISRRGFVGAGAALLASAGISGRAAEKTEKPRIQGFEETEAGCDNKSVWTPYSDKKVRVGIAGEGFCSFGSAFGYQSSPNAVVVACTDLDPKKRALLQQRTKAQKTYPSCEDMIRHAAEDKLDAVYIATDARSHIRLAIMALEHGLNVASAVPALLGKDQLEYVPKLLEAAKRSGKIYMMNETTAFRPQCYAMRKLYEAGYLGAITYSEGEYFHPGANDLGKPLPHDHFSYGAWRWGLPPQYYPTHSNAYYTCVTHKRFTEVTCRGLPSIKFEYTKASENEYGNPYGSEYAFFKCEDGSSSRMLVAWDTPAFGNEIGRIWGQKGCYVPEYRNREEYSSLKWMACYTGWFDKEFKANPSRFLKPRLAPGMDMGGHGGSHGYLTDDFLRAILLKDHKVCVDVVTALNTTVAGIYAHMSAMKDGETLKIPEIKI